MNNVNIKELMKMLSSMSKEDLEKGLKEAKNVLNQKDLSDIIKNMKKGKE